MGAGLSVTAVTDHYVAVRGTAASMRTAFGSPLDSFRTTRGTLWAPRSAVTVPASVAPAVLTITGLSASTARPGTDFAGLRPAPPDWRPAPPDWRPASPDWRLASPGPAPGGTR